jgi:hypothetical protein
MTDVFVVDGNRTFRHVVESGDQVDQRRFAAAGASEYRGDLAGLRRKGNVGKDGFFGAGVTEADITEGKFGEGISESLKRGIFVIADTGLCFQDSLIFLPMRNGGAA